MREMLTFFSFMPFGVAAVQAHKSEGQIASLAALGAGLLFFAGLAWTITGIEVPKSKSQLVLALGTGARWIKVRVRQAENYPQSDTSRSIFWHLCDSIQSGDDPLSGGAPQLIGLYRSFPARTFGIVLDGSRFLNGLRLAGPLTSDVVEWRDKEFQRVDGETMKRLPDAQRHGRTRRKITK